VLGGSISNLGNQFLIGVEATDCASGDLLAQGQVQAASKEEVITTLGKASTSLREKLGESLASIRKFDIPIAEATTPSLDALKAFSQGWKSAVQTGDLATALTFYKRAVELDPNFAEAYGAMALAYNSLGETELGIENSRKAFELRNHASERERFLIEIQYYSLGSFDLRKAEQTCQLWTQTYPRDAFPLFTLGFVYGSLGQFEKARDATVRAIRLDPDNGIAFANLTQIDLSLGRTDEATENVAKARQRNIGGPLLDQMAYYVAFVRRDAASVQQEGSRAIGEEAAEDQLFSAQADTEAFFGRLMKSRDYMQRAIESARRFRLKENAALWEAYSAMREAELGNWEMARREAARASSDSNGWGVQLSAALTLARAGDAVRAEKITRQLAKNNPSNTVFEIYWLPVILGAVELERNNPAKAIEILSTAAPYDLAQPLPFQVGTIYPAFIRGNSYLAAREGSKAAAEFQKILDHPGIYLNFLTGALARLGLARAYAMQGNTAKAKAAYQNFLTLWKDADPDIPVLKQAKAEYAKLQ